MKFVHFKARIYRSKNGLTGAKADKKHCICQIGRDFGTEYSSICQLADIYRIKINRWERAPLSYRKKQGDETQHLYAVSPTNL